MKYEDFDKLGKNNATFLKLMGEEKFLKAFKIREGIWIIPEIFDISNRLDGKTIYEIPNYLTSKSTKEVEEKQEYLDMMEVLFKRIETKILGKEFLEDLANSTPPYSSISLDHRMLFQFEQYDLPNKQSLSKHQEKISVVIHPSQNIYDKSSFYTSSRLGSMGQVRFHLAMTNNVKSPKIRYPNGEIKLNQNNLVFCFDPVMSLLHELIHAYHGLYGLDTQITIPNYTHIIEEEITTKGDAQYTNEISALYHLTAARLCKNIELINSLNLNEEQLSYYAKKYSTNILENKLEISMGKIAFLASKVLFKYLEFKFTEQFGLIYRGTYRVSNIWHKYIPILDESIYTINNGLIVDIHF